NGQASESITANTVAGANYIVTATAGGVLTSASFTLTNVAGSANAIAVTSGSGQSATVNTAFSNPLVATVSDQYGNPVPNATVTFTPPGSGASAVLTGGAKAVTSSNGQASKSVTANTVVGTSYLVTASVGGVAT